MFEQFSERARKVMSLARQEAERTNSEFIGTEHILLGLIWEGGGIGFKVLRNLRVDATKVREQVTAMIPPSAAPKVTLGQLPFSPRAKRVIELAAETASALKSPNVCTGSLLVGLFKENEGIAADVLRKMGVTIEKLQIQMEKVVGSESVAAALDSRANVVKTLARTDVKSMNLRTHMSVEFMKALIGRVSLKYDKIAADAVTAADALLARLSEGVNDGEKHA